MSDDIDITPPEQLDEMFGHKTTDELLASMAAANPAKHGVTVAERLRRARELAEAFDDLSVDDQLIVAAGGDPEEMLPGNKPRWTVAAPDKSGSCTVKDHLTGNEFGQIKIYPADHPGRQPETPPSQDPALAGNAAPTTCDHSFGDDPQDDTPCEKCKISFEDWANL